MAGGPPVHQPATRGAEPTELRLVTGLCVLGSGAKWPLCEGPPDSEFHSRSCYSERIVEGISKGVTLRRPYGMNHAGTFIP